MVGSRGLKGIALGAVLRRYDATDAVAKANNACCTERVSATLSGHYSRNDNQGCWLKGPRSHRRQRNGDRQLFERQNRKVASPPQIQSESSRDRVGVAGKGRSPSAITRDSWSRAPPSSRPAVPGAPAGPSQREGGLRA